jgi:hypothetical protein
LVDRVSAGRHAPTRSALGTQALFSIHAGDGEAPERAGARGEQASMKPVAALDDEMDASDTHRPGSAQITK